MNTPAVMRWPGGVQNIADWSAATGRIFRYQLDYGHTFWLIERQAVDELLGFCGLERADAPGGDVAAGDFEIGWRLREDAWGWGYAEEDAIASLDLAFSPLGAPHVVEVTSLRGEPGQGLMKRLGVVRRRNFNVIDERFPADGEVSPQIASRVDAGDRSAARLAALVR